ncbi:hypothetical protein BV913_11335 [Neisseria dumasiana]|uniref:Secreted protein n=1 Tax=Neisseria dumasiana TaxID=1931275 RepID=A0ABX3WIW2_9NEIS|nr:hypothetical protein BV913_11335 [Neisseria dumasiana]
MCAARSFALAVLLRLELHPHLRVLQRSQIEYTPPPLPLFPPVFYTTGPRLSSQKISTINKKAEIKTI